MKVVFLHKIYIKVLYSEDDYNWCTEIREKKIFQCLFLHLAASSSALFSSISFFMGQYTTFSHVCCVTLQYTLPWSLKKIRFPVIAAAEWKLKKQQEGGEALEWFRLSSFENGFERVPYSCCKFHGSNRLYMYKHIWVHTCINLLCILHKYT